MSLFVILYYAHTHLQTNLHIARDWVFVAYRIGRALMNVLENTKEILQ
jgi:hypothetical protein